eukprot:TRINITY_DN28872_c0_g1_i3.p1 TRINITY_DN28872_c0_g1~~TRINITY_DN28872_c0_g1_i3.p1  ORF type:complete len:104 (-),score=7.29 TRINITY_DN28872_c0_g1_i3:99-410(-)
MCIRDRDTGGFQLKTDRLFSIVHILLNKERVTAKELADQFEVSTRTIYRDIDSLSMSGIPIYTDKGTGGGISLLDNYVLNKTCLLYTSPSPRDLSTSRMPSSA